MAGITAFDGLGNLGLSSVATPPSPATSGLSLTLPSGEGARFPDPAVVGAYNVLITATGSTGATPANSELVRFTAKSGDTFTMARAQESTSARSIVAGDLVILVVTKKMIADMQVAIAALETPTINTQAGSYTAVLGDANKVVQMNSGSAQTFTIPANASVAIPVGAAIEVWQTGAGALTVVITTDTLNRRSAAGGFGTGSFTLTGQGASVLLRKTGTTTWWAAGGIA